MTDEEIAALRESDPGRWAQLVDPTYAPRQQETLSGMIRAAVKDVDRRVAVAFRKVGEIVSPLFGKVSALERRVAAGELNAHATIIQAAAVFDRLNATMLAPIRPVYEKGVLVGAVREGSPRNGDALAKLSARIDELALKPGVPATSAVTAALERLSATISAPQKILYDERGRIIGAQRAPGLAGGPSADALAVLEARVAALEARLPLSYGGVWSPGTQSTKGVFYTHQGSVWFCLKSTRDRPGESPNFVLACKRGADGKDAR